MFEDLSMQREMPAGSLWATPLFKSAWQFIFVFINVCGPDMLLTAKNTVLNNAARDVIIIFLRQQSKPGPCPTIKNGVEGRLIYNSLKSINSKVYGNFLRFLFNNCIIVIFKI